MKTLKALLVLLTVLFSFQSQASIKGLLLNLEKDIKEGAPQKEIELKVKSIKRLKESFPIYYIPELNYLLNSEVEPIPETRVSTLKHITFLLEPIKRGTLTVLFIVLFYTLIFFSQNLKVNYKVKRALTLTSISLLTLSITFNLLWLTYLLSGVGLAFLIPLKRKKAQILLATSTAVLLISTTLSFNLTLKVNSPDFLFIEKVKRDGYAPEFLIDKALKNPTHREIEKVTNDLALGEIEASERLKGIRISDPYLLGIVYNNFGYSKFMKGEYEDALKLFKKARDFTSSPAILFNIYLTYSAMLMIEEAQKVKEELLREDVDISNVTPIPLLIHIYPEEGKIFFPTIQILFLIVGGLAGLISIRYLKFDNKNINSEILLIPGMTNFVNSKVRFILIVGAIVMAINLILGRIVCSI